MGGLSQQGFGSSFHHEEVNNIDLRNDEEFKKISKIKNKPKKKK